MPLTMPFRTNSHANSLYNQLRTSADDIPQPPTSPQHSKLNTIAMKMKTTLTLLFAATVLVTSAQKGPFDSNWESNDSIPFVWDGGIYLPATIDNKYPANILFTTNANRQLVVDTTYLKELCWQPLKIEKAKIKREKDTLRLKTSYIDRKSTRLNSSHW